VAFLLGALNGHKRQQLGPFGWGGISLLSPQRARGSKPSEKTPEKKRELGLWAGSSPSKTHEIKAGLERLKELGVKPRFPALSRRYAHRSESKERKFLAGPDEAKIKAFCELWRDPHIHDILCVRGGYGTLRLLEGLEHKTLKAHAAKRLWGFSDLTTLQNYLYFRLGSAWVHSPMLTSGSFQKPRPDERKFLESLSSQSHSEHRLKLVHTPKPCTHDFEITLPLIGGNLACFVSLIGTKWARPHRKAFLLVLEDVSERGYRVDRLLQQLRGAPLMKYCRGVVMGHFTRCPGAQGILLRWAQEEGLLLLAGLRAGHQRPNLPIPMGIPVTLQIKKSGPALLKTPNLRLG
jgi:muramoyltetrapeptide carboxypeptidase